MKRGEYRKLREQLCALVEHEAARWHVLSVSTKAYVGNRTGAIGEQFVFEVRECSETVVLSYVGAAETEACFAEQQAWLDAVEQFYMDEPRPVFAHTSPEQSLGGTDLFEPLNKAAKDKLAGLGRTGKDCWI
jgi:hypothetical protein